MNKYLFALILSILTFSSFAGTITGGDLLNQADANQLESWLGVGDQDFTNIWDGTTGDTSSSWHQAVDGISETISIYEIIFQGQTLLIGGYNSSAWASGGQFHHDTNSFIFNLTTNVMQDQSTPQNVNDAYSTFNNSAHFASFGGGLDLYGGSNTLGAVQGLANSFTYGSNHQNTNIIGNICSVNNTYCFDYFTVAGLETYTIDTAIQIPEPFSLAFFGLALLFIKLSSLRQRMA